MPQGMGGKFDEQLCGSLLLSDMVLNLQQQKLNRYLPGRTGWGGLQSLYKSTTPSLRAAVSNGK